MEVCKRAPSRSQTSTMVPHCPPHTSAPTLSHTLPHHLTHPLVPQEEEAEELYERAMQAREKHLGMDHLDTTATVACLAAVKYNLGRLEEAAQLYKRVVNAQRKWANARPSQQVRSAALPYLTSGPWEGW